MKKYIIFFIYSIKTLISFEEDWVGLSKDQKCSIMFSWYENYDKDSGLRDTYGKFYKKYVAEATYLSVKMGLSDDFKKMSYKQAFEFDPILESRNKSEISEKITKLYKNFILSFFIFDKTYVIRQAIFNILHKEKGFKWILNEKEKYEKEKYEKEILNIKKFK